MRLRNFCVQMGFAIFVAVILIVFFHNVPLAVLYVIGHLIWALFSDKQTVYGSVGDVFGKLNKMIETQMK